MSVKSNSTQTGTISVTEQESQSFFTTETSIQTDPVQKSSNVYAEYDVASLSNFLHRVEETVCSYLERNLSSQAFDNYELLSDTESSAMTCLHSLEKPQADELSCSSFSWNTTGTSIAAAYTNASHEHWCDHDGEVAVWSLNQRGFDPKKPKIVLETDCCVTQVAFHPTVPALLVAGKFNGEIMVWNISKEDDPLLGSSEASFKNHREPITGLVWLPESSSFDSIRFLSHSMDGKILIWELEKNVLIPKDGFIVLSEFLPKMFQIKSTRENSEIGILSLSINTEDPSIFIIGAEGGCILQGSFSSLKPATYSEETVQLKNPITMCFERHKGQVTSVQFSPFSRNVFVSCGSDGEVRIYNLLQTKPVLILSSSSISVNSTIWSLVRPLVLYSVCSNGELHIWDLMSNSKQPVEIIQMDSKHTAGMSISYNKCNQNLMASSLSNGKIFVYQLPGFVLKPYPEELQQLLMISRRIDS